MGMDLDLRRLRLFTEVVRRGGFTRAAEAAFATQPTVSKAVKQLEDELGFVLFDRIGRRSDLTAAGKVVYARAIDLLARSADLLVELDAMRGLKRGTLRIAFPRLGSTALFAPMYASFRHRYPGIDVGISAHDRRRIEELLRAGELDLGVIAHPIPEDFDSQELRADRLAALLPRDHPAAAQRDVSLSRLAEMPLVLSGDEPTLDDLVLEAYRKRKLTPTVAARSAQVDFVFELVAAGTGIAFLPRPIAEQRRHRAVRSLPLKEPRLEWRIAICWLRGAHLSAAARAWLAHARETASSIGATR
jgi:DNA-binding transcriptional LysR family regulator